MIAMLLVPPGTMAQDSGESEQTDRFSKEELTQMLAPIALYPDSLIAEILMASTYPLELVEAERWLRQNKELKGDALNTALQEKTWDPSVKSLCHFPDVLFAMSDKLDQTRKLGDAFLSQEDEVMAVIQELRHRAEQSGESQDNGTTEGNHRGGDHQDRTAGPGGCSMYRSTTRSMYMVHGGILTILPITGTIRPVLLSAAGISVMAPAFFLESDGTHGHGSTGMSITSM